MNICDNGFGISRKKLRDDVEIINALLLDNGEYSKEDIKEENREQQLFILNQGL